MRKEIITAIFAGVIVGLAIAFGTWRVNGAFKSKQNDPSKTASTIQQTGDPSQEKLAISLVQIEDYDVFTQTPIKITGITKPGSIVVISAEGEDYALEPDPDGTFEQDVDLTGGVNQILFSVLDKNGEKVSKKVTVVYSSEFAKSVNQ
jgi:hypothetical protein